MTEKPGPQTSAEPYARLGVVMAISFGAMLALSMMMIEQWDHFQWNLSNAYMAMTMVAVMGLIMVVGMWGTMLKNPKLNVILIAGFAALLVAGFALGRSSTLIDDSAFMRSMIPHHSRAILICEQAALNDPDVIALCRGIIASQRSEIAQMQGLLQRGVQ